MPVCLQRQGLSQLWNQKEMGFFCERSLEYAGFCLRLDSLDMRKLVYL